MHFIFFSPCVLSCKIQHCSLISASFASPERRSVSQPIVFTSNKNCVSLYGTQPLFVPNVVVLGCQGARVSSLNV